MKRLISLLAAVLLGAGMAWAAGPGGENAIDLSGYAKKSDIPTPADTMPPATDVSGAKGTSTTQYALKDHTHATSVQRTRMTIPVTGQPIAWTFVKPYDAGVSPIVVCTAQNAAAATRPFVVNVVGAPSNTQAQVIVFQAAQPTVALLGINLTLFGQAATGAVVDCQAAKPTQ